MLTKYISYPQENVSNVVSFINFVSSRIFIWSPGHNRSKLYEFKIRIRSNSRWHRVQFVFYPVSRSVYLIGYLNITCRTLSNHDKSRGETIWREAFRNQINQIVFANSFSSSNLLNNEIFFSLEKKKINIFAPEISEWRVSGSGKGVYRKNNFNYLN